MDEMRVYIANLGKYNEGELVGDWFAPLIDWDDLKERIGLNSEYEEYAIHDWELLFEISEYTSIEEINLLCSMAEGLASTDIGEAPVSLQNYIDYESYGRDLEISGSFVVTNHGVFECSN